jgi:hypothetical protein
VRHCEVFCYRIEQLRAFNLLLTEERKTVRQQQKCWSAIHIRAKYVVKIRTKYVVKIRVKYVVKIRVKYVV